MSTQSELLAERAELISKNEAATSWGAAVGARSERIKAIDSELRRLESAVPESVRDAQQTLDPLSRAAALARELRRFHRNACYPDAMDSEINETMQRIAALSAAQCAPQPSGEPVGDFAAALVQQLREKALWRDDIHHDLHIAAADLIERLAAPPAVSCAAREALEDSQSLFAMIYQIRADAAWWEKEGLVGLLEEQIRENRAVLDATPEAPATERDAIIKECAAIAARVAAKHDTAAVARFKKDGEWVARAASDAASEVEDEILAILSLPAAGGEASKREADLREALRTFLSAWDELQPGLYTDEQMTTWINSRAMKHAVQNARAALTVVPDERNTTASGGAS